MSKPVLLFFFVNLIAALGAAQQDAPLVNDGEPIRIGPGVERPKLIHKVEPQYSQAALDARVQGTVLLDLFIDRNGLPQKISVVSPLGFGLDERAEECVSKWRFKPATKDGNPIALLATVQINFHLGNIGFDDKSERDRTRFNAAASRIAKQNGRPSESELKIMQELAVHKMPAAEYAIGSWELSGDVLPKNETEGFALIQKAAGKNYGPAIFAVGKAQIKGKLVPKDEAGGLSLIRDAAVLGSKQAQFVLGDKYEKGAGVEVDLGRAKRYFRLCAASGTGDCQYRLGRLLLASPERKENDWLQGIAWLQLAHQHKVLAAESLVNQEAAKLTPDQAQWVARLTRQLERVP